MIRNPSEATGETGANCPEQEVCDGNTGSSRNRRRTESLRRRVLGILALMAGGLCTYGSLALDYGTFIDSRTQHRTLIDGVLIGVAVFPLLWCAWRLLGRSRRADILLIGVVNLVQLTWRIVDWTRILG